jgi:hypothetical protein
MEEAIKSMLTGNTCLFFDKTDTAIIINSAKPEKRSIDKPESEVSILGSKDSFTEDIKTNCMLVRRRIPNPDLHFKTFTAGRLSQTKIRMA